MGTVISNLKARFGVDTADFKSGLKDGEKAISEFKEAGSDQISEFAGMFGVNMSGVTNAVSLASKSLSFLRASFVATSEGASILSVASLVLKYALIATGIGALVVVLGSVAAYFTKSAEGSDKFAKILAQVKAVFNDVIERFIVFGKGVADLVSGKWKQGWEEMRDSFKGIGQEIKEDVKAAGELAEKNDKLERTEIALIVTASARKAKIMELRQLAKEELDDNKKKLSLLEQAEKLIKQVYGEEIDLENKKLAAMAEEAGLKAAKLSPEAIKNEEREITLLKEKLGLQGKDITMPQLKEIAEQVAKVNGLYRDQAGDLKAILREKNATITAVEKELALFGSFKNLKMPDLMQPYENAMKSMQITMDKLHHTFIQTKEDTGALFQVMDQVGVNVGNVLKDTFQELAVSTSEFLGALMNGTANIGNFGDAIAKIFGKMLVTIGTAMIAAGIAKLNFDTLITAFGGGPGIIAAGIAVAAFGAAISGAVGGTVKSGSTGSSMSAGSSAGGKGMIYDSRKTSGPAPTPGGDVHFTIRGTDLVGVLKNENTRYRAST